MKTLIKPIVWFCGVLLATTGLAQTIQNPLVRPPGLGAGGASSGAGAAVGGNAAVSGGADNPGQGANGQGAGPRGEELREKASNRLSQEDFNLKQQALNSAVVPTPLQNLFASMTAIATVSGQVVFRRFEGASAGVQASQVFNQAAPSSTNASSPQAASTPRATPSLVGGSYNPALRLRLGKPINLNGYTVRARMDGLDVTVEWKDDKNEWVTIFYGAVESIASAQSSASSIELEKVDTRSFDYLVPKVSSRIVGNTAGGQTGAGNGGIGNQPAGNFGSPSPGGGQTNLGGF